MDEIYTIPKKNKRMVKRMVKKRIRTILRIATRAGMGPFSCESDPSPLPQLVIHLLGRA